jgi:hypothetical protein|tara:strand:- start:679 stop:930 length:252 start_codon:yes stop_codon:yes gene_type:complete
MESSKKSKQSGDVGAEEMYTAYEVESRRKRDFFAVESILSALCILERKFGREEYISMSGDELAGNVAELAYRIADAMMKERER